MKNKYRLIDPHGLFEWQGRYYTYNFSTNTYNLVQEFWNSELKLCGIYRIKNNVTGMSYVGSSVDLVARIEIHKTYINKYAKGSTKERRDLLLYKDALPWSNYTWSILKLCKYVELDRWEMYYIDFYQTGSPNGYNKATVIHRDIKTTRTLLNRKEELQVFVDWLESQNCSLDLLLQNMWQYSYENVLIDVYDDQYDIIIKTLESYRLLHPRVVAGSTLGKLCYKK